MSSSQKSKKSRGALHVLVKEAKNLVAAKANGMSDPFCKRYTPFRSSLLFVLGIGSAVALHGAVITVICDLFRLQYWRVALGASLVGFLVGLVYVTPTLKSAFTANQIGAPKTT